ncbi:MAG: nicotinate-nucleotide--dimethylbenzimidazole phosphoribosyltransferase [Chloroflexi bacterium HGW-Chloroflexi-10]|nr:MAG: nicotinate-nucleotide--dimethylbenzimidazole phosphoribosyltransferase [Chloroflexi bacterium HGW-Chloroflexi-10]
MHIPAIPLFDEQAATAASKRQDTLTKPAGALGRLEALSIQLAGITGNPRPHFEHKGVIIMAGDHGVTAEGVSAYPSEVTAQMVLNFLHGGAAVNVLARQANAIVRIVDIGVKGNLPEQAGLIQARIAPGTANMALGPAMTRAQAEAAIQIGLDVVNREIDAGLQLVATGEMGIGNTTAAAAITAFYSGISPTRVVGRGTGITDEQLALKDHAIRRAFEINQPDTTDAVDVLHKIGGLEIAGLVGVILGASARRVPVVVDGFISSSAALIALKLAPAVKDCLIASHSSAEQGHRVLLDQLGLEPLINLNLRLGEGTGAVLAFHLVEAACRTLNEMATFAEASVSGKE